MNRSNSLPDLINGNNDWDHDAIREPGGFRRHFLSLRAERQGKKPPNFLTKNFMDFLILYGFYGGDIYPSEDEYDSDEEFEPTDPERFNEASPLLHRQHSMQSIQGTSEAKAFFMLLKAFVGTGVLFLPKAFLNGGIIFSVVLMTVLAILTTYCMCLLADCSKSFGGKSFGDLGELLYGSNCKFLILASISISQMVANY
jgi:proton-coupled amino acid transporter